MTGIRTMKYEPNTSHGLQVRNKSYSPLIFFLSKLNPLFHRTSDGYGPHWNMIAAGEQNRSSLKPNEEMGQ